jgi:hypothetical protein
LATCGALAQVLAATSHAAIPFDKTRCKNSGGS